MKTNNQLNHKLTISKMTISSLNSTLGMKKLAAGQIAAINGGGLKTN